MKMLCCKRCLAHQFYVSYVRVSAVPKRNEGILLERYPKLAEVYINYIHYYILLNVTLEIRK